jgi:hypothetical protein
MNEADLLDDVEVAEPSLRDQLSEAIEEHDPNHELIPKDEGLAPVQEVQPPISTEKPKDESPAAAPSTPPADASVPPLPGSPSVASTELKAPAQWKPAVREKWNGLPREVQEEVLRRESDNMRLIGSVGPKIRMADEVQGHIAPFVERLAENGVAPQAFVHDVFNSVKQLASGDAQQRAEVVANIVQSYGVDLQTLDRILTARITAPPEVLHARIMMDRAAAVIQHQRNGVEYENAEKATQTLAAFAADPQHEFYADVKDMMADLIELGRATNLNDAYAAAVWSNPDTRKILQQREAQSRVSQRQTRANAARRASSSVHGAPSSPRAASANGAAEGSLRDQIAAAFDEHSPL